MIYMIDVYKRQVPYNQIVFPEIPLTVYQLAILRIKEDMLPVSYTHLDVYKRQPHIHAIVLGGGLDVKNHWKDNGKDFFLPIKVISKTFRGKYMAELRQLWENDKLEFHGSAALEKIYPVF